MKRDIRGIDVTIMYVDGSKATGHLSPDGVHIPSASDTLEFRRALTLMREGVDGAFLPYGQH